MDQKPLMKTIRIPPIQIPEHTVEKSQESAGNSATRLQSGLNGSSSESEQVDDIEINGMTLRGANKCLDFNEALELYSHNPKRIHGFQMLYQKMSFIAIMIGIMSSTPI